MTTYRKHCSSCNVTVVDTVASGDGKDDSQPGANDPCPPPQPKAGPSEEEVKNRRKKLRRNNKSWSTNIKPTKGSNVTPTKVSAKAPASEKQIPTEIPKPAAPLSNNEALQGVPPPPRCAYENLILNMLHLRRPQTAWPRLKELSDMIAAERRSAAPAQPLTWCLTVFWGSPVTPASKLVFRTLDAHLATHSSFAGRWFGIKACILRHDQPDGGASSPYSMSEEDYHVVEMDNTVRLIGKMDAAVRCNGDERVVRAWRMLFETGDAIVQGPEQDRDNLYKVLGAHAKTLKDLVDGDEHCMRIFKEFEDATRIPVDVEAEVAAFDIWNNGNMLRTPPNQSAPQGNLVLEFSKLLEPNGNSSELASSEWDCEKEFDFLREASTRVMVGRLKYTQTIASLHEDADKQAREGEKIIKIVKDAQLAEDQKNISPKRLVATHVLWQSQLISTEGTLISLASAIESLALAEIVFTKLLNDVNAWDERRAEKLAAKEEELKELEAKMGELQVKMDMHQAKDHAAEAAEKIKVIMEETRQELREIEKRKRLGQDPVYTVCKEALSAAEHTNPDAGSGDWPSEVAESEGSVRGVGWENVPSRSAPTATNLYPSIAGQKEVVWDV
ncbi:hypothetical protein ACKVWM_008451 [Pyricularia oryzae]